MAEGPRVRVTVAWSPGPREVREWSVSDHPYVVVEQDGEWRMCGYAE